MTPPRPFDEHGRRARDHARLLERCPHGRYLYIAGNAAGTELLRAECTDCVREERDIMRAALIEADGLLAAGEVDDAIITIETAIAKTTHDDT